MASMMLLTSCTTVSVPSSQAGCALETATQRHGEALSEHSEAIQGVGAGEVLVTGSALLSGLLTAQEGC